MGIFSKKSTTNVATTNQYFTDNSNVAVAEGGLSLQDSTLTLVDPGSFAFAGDVVDKSLKFATDAVGKSTKETADVLTKFQEQGAASLAALVKTSQSDTAALTENVFLYGAGALTLLGIAAAWAYSRRGRA